MNADIRLPPRTPVHGRVFRRERPSRRVAHVPRVKNTLANWMFLILLLGMSIETIQIGGAQPGQLVAILMLPMLLARRLIKVTGFEVWAYALLVGVSLSLTFLSGYPSIKAPDQILKFVFLYPACYLIGRFYGSRHQTRPLPYTYWMLGIFLVWQYLIQKLNIPVLFKEIDFGQGALHGSFRERNWIATFFFLTSYLLFLQSRKSLKDFFCFLAIPVAITVLSQSKTVLVPCAIVLMFQVRGYVPHKIVMMIAGTALYIYQFASELTGDGLQVRLKEERGLAFSESVKLLQRDWLGHGYGFVEHFFANSSIAVKGLGAGTNAVFCSPLDMALIAGPVGVLAWLVFFCGLGSGWRCMRVMAPLAAWSVTNPMHQNEMSYLFLGFMAAFSTVEVRTHRKRSAFASARKLNSLDGRSA